MRRSSIRIYFNGDVFYYGVGALAKSQTLSFGVAEQLEYEFFDNKTFFQFMEFYERPRIY